MHQLKSDLSNTGTIFSVSLLSLQLVISPYKTQTEICTLGNEKMELCEMAEKTHNPIKIRIATNSTILTIASKWKDTVPAFKFYRIAVVHILYQNCGFNSSFEGVLFWFRKYLEGYSAISIETTEKSLCKRHYLLCTWADLQWRWLIQLDITQLPALADSCLYRGGDYVTVILFWAFSFIMIHLGVTWAISNIKVILSYVG